MADSMGGQHGPHHHVGRLGLVCSRVRPYGHGDAGFGAVVCPFVEWDRYLLCGCDKGDFTRVYGWIDREDNYKDFVVLDFLHRSREVVYICSSSSEYSERICTIIDEEGDPGVE